MRGGHQRDSDVIIEFVQSGNVVKVSAIDVYTHEEVSLVGDPRRSRDELTQLAVRKLRYVQSKR